MEGSVDGSMKSAYTAINFFKKDHIWVDLTDDLKNRTRKYLALFSDYVACLHDDDDDKEESIDPESV